jgi:Uma2 family endonuclease
MTAATVPSSQPVVQPAQPAHDAVSAALTDVSPSAADNQTLQPHRWSGEEYRRLYQLGVFPAERRSQLIQGEVYFMAAMGKAHHTALRILGRLFFRRYGDLAEVIQQSPIVVWNDSEPEPDFALLRADFTGGLPLASDVLLAVEISDSTLRFDQQKKLPTYAQSGIGETWILNLSAGVLEVYRQPDGGEYLSRQILKPNTTITPLFAPAIPLEWWLALESAAASAAPATAEAAAEAG